MPSRVGLLILLLVAAAACASPGASAPAASAQPPLVTGAAVPAAATPGPTVLPTLPPGAATALPIESPWAHANAAELARTLATRVADARTDAARQAALLQVMRALNIGVYTADGVAVLRGAERGPHDFYLYDFELAMMAASLSRQDAWSIADMTAALNEMGIRRTDKPLAVEQLTSVLFSVTREASQSPASRLSLPVLLVRELGLRQPTAYDLLKEPKQDALSFSALQKFLLTIDIVLPIVREAKIASGPSQLAAESNGVLQLKSVSQSSACDSMVATIAKEGWGAGKLFLTLTGVLNIKFSTAVEGGTIVETLNPAALALVVIDALHGEMLAFSVKVQELPDQHETHYGHEGPGEELRFRVIVAMLDQLPEIVIKCGWLLGVEFPNKGGIPGVKMLWVNGGLDEHGAVICEATCRQTGTDGIATLVFKPKNEAPFYGWGPEYQAFGRVAVIALYQSRHKNYLGSVAQLLTPKGGIMTWSVIHHIQPDLELRIDTAIDGTSTTFWLTTSAHARVRLQYDAAIGWHGDGELNNLTIPKPQTKKCEMVIEGGSGTTSFKVVKGQITGGGKPSIVMPITPGGLTASYSGYLLSPTGCKRYAGPFVQAFFPLMWEMSHIEILDTTMGDPADINWGGGYRMRDWEIVQSGATPQAGLFARKTLKGNCKGHCTETTKLELSVLP